MIFERGNFVPNILRIYAVQPKLKLGHKILNYDKKID